MFGMIKNYWKETQRPVYSAALVFPFLCIYHAGTVVLNATYINGADALIMRFLGMFSVRSMFASTLILAVYFAVWQYRTRASLKINPQILLSSFLESLALAIILLLFFGKLVPIFSASTAATQGEFSHLVLYCGAGIYEELVFRAFLLGFLLLIYQKGLGLGRTRAAISAAITAALLFSLFHYVGPAGDIFSIGSFVQRALSGLYFSILYVTRGFGITASCHVCYDILVGFILS
jgi:membrane protease YdiL (CAAX protease family)